MSLINDIVVKTMPPAVKLSGRSVQLHRGGVRGVGGRIVVGRGGVVGCYTKPNVPTSVLQRLDVLHSLVVRLGLYVSESSVSDANNVTYTVNGTQRRGTFYGSPDGHRLVLSPEEVIAVKVMANVETMPDKIVDNTWSLTTLGSTDPLLPTVTDGKVVYIPFNDVEERIDSNGTVIILGVEMIGNAYVPAVFLGMGRTALQAYEPQV